MRLVAPCRHAPAAGLLCLALALGTAAAAEETVAVQVGRVITVSGEEIENGMILVQGGRIRAVGADLEIPWDARVHRFPRSVAMPGMIDCHSTIGLRTPNEVLQDVPFVSVLDGLDPLSPAIASALRDGITVAHVIPANATRIGGQGAVIRLKGRTIEELVIRSPSALKISLGPSRGESRSQSMYLLRKRFLDLYRLLDGLAREEGEPEPLETRPDARESLAALLDGAPPWERLDFGKIPREKLEPEWRPLLELVEGKLPAFIHCERASDVLRAFRLIDAQRLKATLVLPPDAYKLPEILKARAGLGPVILDDRLEVRETDAWTGKETRHAVARRLHEAGIRFALQTAGGRSPATGPRIGFDGGVHLWYQAALLVRHGVPRTEALRSVTLTPAEILGLDHRMGSIQEGKDANLVIFSGDPLDARSWVELVLIEGEEAYRRDRDRDLELLLRDPERAF